MKPCINCDGFAAVCASAKTSRGQRRRWQCKSCGYTWTEVGGDKPSGHIRKQPPPVAMIRDALTSDEGDSVLSRRYKVARSTIWKIRTGESYADVLPEIPRTSQRTATCEQCHHWQPQRVEPCDLGHQDPLQTGIRFARWCASFKEAA